MPANTTPTSPSVLLDLKVGDRVQVFDVNARKSQPKGGADGEVVKVGRKLVTVRYGRHGYTQVFRLDGGRANDDYGHQWIETPEQAAENQRRDDLEQRLRDHGLQFSLATKPLPTRTLEAVVSVLDREREETSA